MSAKRSLNPRGLAAVRQGGNYQPRPDARTHPAYNRSRGLVALAGGGRKRAMRGVL